MSFEERIYAFRDIKDMEPTRGAKTPNKDLREERFELGVAIWLECRRRIQTSDVNIIKARWGSEDFNYLCYYIDDSYIYNTNGYMYQNLHLPLFSFGWESKNVYPVLVQDDFYFYVMPKDSVYKLSRFEPNNWKELCKIIYDFTDIINREFSLAIDEYLRVKKERPLVKSLISHNELDMENLYKKRYGEVTRNKK